MSLRHVLLCLPERPSEDVLELARTVKAALGSKYRVRLRLAGEVEEDFDDDTTPVDSPFGEPLVVRIEQPPDGGEGTM